MLVIVLKNGDSLILTPSSSLLAHTRHCIWSWHQVDVIAWLDALAMQSLPHWWLCTRVWCLQL